LQNSHELLQVRHTNNSHPTPLLSSYLLLSSSSKSPCLFSTTTYAPSPGRHNRHFLFKYSLSLHHEVYTSVFSPSLIMDRWHTNCRVFSSSSSGLDFVPFLSATSTIVGSRLYYSFNFRSQHSLALVPHYSLPVAYRVLFVSLTPSWDDHFLPWACDKYLSSSMLIPRFRSRLSSSPNILHHRRSVNVRGPPVANQLLHFKAHMTDSRVARLLLSEVRPFS
jgi:hypothetical protein